MTVTAIKQSKHRSELRTGYTTGACATAAALAALKTLLGGTTPAAVTIKLPGGSDARFDLAQCQLGFASVIKDAGDDPDCTHGANISATVELSSRSGIEFVAGEGVATVTKPGLELGVGEPAINPVPRKMIREHLLPLLQQHQHCGAKVTIAVVGGEAMAEHTIGRRLGLIGGISILGTRGTVYPYSTSAYAASVRQNVEVAVAAGHTQMVLTTGSRTERAAMAARPNWEEIQFAQAGDFCGVGLRAAARYGVTRISLVTMIGKLCKIAGGTTMTHVTGRAIQFKLLAAELAAMGASAEVCRSVAAANTGRHLFSLVPVQWHQQFFQRLCQMAARHCYQYSHNKVIVEVELIDFDGSLLATACHGE
ncbi:cobalt-precorrin-5B (C(1))-methyltransferase [Ferrimonas lipolytica]|uniref:Cobalt-precorrin-5B C(1)-methyltransferase n=1 Tax=Ferrimonas lipolytica TaxID=2724191 RepID=A0A6H1UBU4_9GAMM|nr:cobalt-precorrin-5B (C(1))-methyltransferase [Ferrimonas lipolytica]QIZ76308.1 cobalt-precorrin-5B (C(1))-methyltransferase [Ferrimonas lipolytica]